MDKYRLYIDESGNHTYSKNLDIKARYLGLTGVIVSEETNVNILHPKILELKRFIANDPDDICGLHRDEIITRAGEYKRLADPEVEKEFNRMLLELLSELDFAICTIVLDKKSHLDRYQGSAQHPYHYCMDMLLERYTHFLEEKKARGDVLAETRGRVEDEALAEKYQQFYSEGTTFCRPGYIQNRLTSKEIKIKPKTKMIAGLELADLLSLATKLDTLHAYGVVPKLEKTFFLSIINTIQPKYRASAKGTINGYGRKLVA